MVLRCDQIGTGLFTAQDLFPDHSKSRSIAGSKLIRLRRIQTVEPAGMEFILSLAKGCDKNGDPGKRYSLVQSPVLSLIICVIRAFSVSSVPLWFVRIYKVLASERPESDMGQASKQTV